MPPQIKQDLNRSGWETTDFPSVCENCLPDNPYVQMLKDDHGAECKIVCFPEVLRTKNIANNETTFQCTRPFTVFRWKADRTARTKRTNICLTCARLKNCCQCCMLDLSFGLPIVVRDAALKMVAPGPESSINREYYAQNNEREIEEGRGGTEEYDKTEDKARELLRRLANSEPYYKRQRRLEAGEDAEKVVLEGSEQEGQKSITAAPRSIGPIRTQDSRGGRGGTREGMSRGRGGGRGGKIFPSTAQLPPQPQDILPPRDPHITSLFVTGVEDDLPEHALRTFFTPFGVLRSLICSHRSHCAFINYATREGAEAAAEHCQGRAVVQGCPLRVRWGKPKALDHLDTEERMANARAGRDTARAIKVANGPAQIGAIQGAPISESIDDLAVIAPPPGQDEVHYASLSGT